MKKGILIFSIIAVAVCTVVFYMAGTLRFFGIFINRFFPCTQSVENSFPCYGVYDIGIMIFAAILSVIFLGIALYGSYKRIMARKINTSLVVVGCIIIALLIGITIPKLIAFGTVGITYGGISNLIPTVPTFPPAGWYVHDRSTSGSTTHFILTRAKDLPDIGATEGYAYGEQIDIAVSTTSLSAETYMDKLGYGSGFADVFGGQANWNTLMGHKMYSATFASEADEQWLVVLFGGDKVYSFMLYPNNPQGPNIQQDRNDFWQVIGHYAQDKSFQMISRTETLQDCKTHNLPPGQEYDIQVDSDTGYVTFGYWLDTPGGYTQESYLFLNYNDDLSQCSPDVQKLLSTVKAGVEKHDTDIKIKPVQ